MAAARGRGEFRARIAGDAGAGFNLSPKAGALTVSRPSLFLLPGRCLRRVESPVIPGPWGLDPPFIIPQNLLLRTPTGGGILTALLTINIFPGGAALDAHTSTLPHHGLGVWK